MPHEKTGRSPDEPARTPDVACYEITVGGRLGPTMLSALPHRAAVARDGLLVTLARADDKDLVDLAHALLAHGIDVQCVRRTDD